MFSRVPAGWHEPLYSVRLERERTHNTSLHGSKSSDQLAQKINGTDNHHTSNHLTTSQSESCLDDHDVKFPIIIFSHGISGNRLCYSTLCASLASYGFVVVALEHRLEIFSIFLEFKNMVNFKFFKLHKLLF